MSSSTLRSSLFPYTTLFRSPLTFALLLTVNLYLIIFLIKIDTHQKTNRDLFSALIFDASIYRQLNSVDEDRKSTRLNSSHVATSYAVFCLQKKIITIYKQET